MRVVQRTITGAGRTIVVAQRLIEQSQWFEITPLPFDNYEFKVKAENAAMLESLQTAVCAVRPLADDEDGEQSDHDME